MLTVLLRPFHRLIPCAAAALLAVPAVATTPADSPDGDPTLIQHILPAELLDIDGMRPPTPRGLTFSLIDAGVDPEGDTPTQVVFTPDGTRFLVAHRDTQNVIVYDAATRAHVDTFNVSGAPQSLAVTADYAVTANLWEDTASIITLATGQERIVPVGDQPGIARVTPDGTKAVIANLRDGDISVIDLASATELRRIDGAGFTASLSFAPEPGVVTFDFGTLEVADNSTAVNADYFNARINVIDLNSGSVTAVPCANNPRGLAIVPGGNTAVITHYINIRTITLLDIPSRTISGTILTPEDLWGPVAVNPTGTQAVVAIQNACRVVDLVNGTFSGSLNTASVNQLYTSADGDYALCVGFRGSLISFASQTVVKELNNIVSTAIGAHSPTDPRGVLIATTFGEDMLVVNTNGAAGFLEGRQLSGPDPEADKTRMLALSPDGTKAVTTNILSDTASIIDLASGTVDAVVDVGDRPAEVAFGPDGGKAVVCNLDSAFTSIIDIATGNVTNVNISRRQSEVEISPDGQYAYIAVVADGDGVWRVDLDTATVAGPKLTTGNMGSVGYLYSQTSGVTLSHDGATLVTCNSFDDTLTFINTATWSVSQTLFVGDFPVRATFSADDSTLYVSCRDDDTVRVLTFAGNWSVTSTINVGDQPLDTVLSPDQTRLYVMNYASESVGVVNLPGTTQSATVPLPDNPATGLRISPDGSEVYVATGTWTASLGPGPAVSLTLNGQLSAIDTATNTISRQVTTNQPPAMLALSGDGATAAIAAPFFDLLVVSQVGGTCPGDLDGDGDVDFQDLVTLLAAYGSGPGGDIDGDGDTDFNDLVALLAVYGTSC